MNLNPSESSLNWPVEACEQGKVRDFTLVQGPVPRGEGSGQNHLVQSRQEEKAPQKSKDIVKLAKNKRQLVSHNSWENCNFLFTE